VLGVDGQTGVNVVDQVPAVVIRVVVHHKVIAAVPAPVSSGVPIPRGDLEVEAAWKPEAVMITIKPLDAKTVTRTNVCKAPVLERMGQVIAFVIGLVVPIPLVVVHVRNAVDVSVRAQLGFWRGAWLSFRRRLRKLGWRPERWALAVHALPGGIHRGFPGAVRMPAMPLPKQKLPVVLHSSSYLCLRFCDPRGRVLFSIWLDWAYTDVVDMTRHRRSRIRRRTASRHFRVLRFDDRIRSDAGKQLEARKSMFPTDVVIVAGGGAPRGGPTRAVFALGGVGFAPPPSPKTHLRPSGGAGALGAAAF